LTVLLQVLDEGRLTDSKGRTVDFTNTVIILTSNIGAHALLEITEDSQQAKEQKHEIVMASVKNHFSPEFLNRLSAIVMFNSLGEAQLEKICHNAMSGVKRRLETQGIRVVLENSGAKAILAASFDSQYGARPLERYLERTVVTTLSKMLISGELASGSLVRIEAVDSDETSLDDCGVPLKKQKTQILKYRVEKDDQFEELMDGTDTTDMEE